MFDFYAELFAPAASSSLAPSRAEKAWRHVAAGTQRAYSGTAAQAAARANRTRAGETAFLSPPRALHACRAVHKTKHRTPS